MDFFFAAAAAFVVADLGGGDFAVACGFDCDADGLSEAAGVACCENAGTQLRSPPSAPSASTHRNLKPNRPTLIIFAWKRERNLYFEMQNFLKKISKAWNQSVNCACSTNAAFTAY